MFVFKVATLELIWDMFPYTLVKLELIVATLELIWDIFPYTLVKLELIVATLEFIFATLAFI